MLTKSGIIITPGGDPDLGPDPLDWLMSGGLLPRVELMDCAPVIARPPEPLKPDGAQFQAG
eukprot:834260-Pyramimonas_sp.AAC.1